MNAKITALADQAMEQLRGLLIESAAEIEAAMIECAEEAQLNEKEAKMAIGFTMTVSLDSNKVNYALAYSIRRKRDVDAELPDPNQPDLPMGKDEGETTMEMRMPDGTTTGPIPVEKFKAAVNEIKRRRSK